MVVGAYGVLGEAVDEEERRAVACPLEMDLDVLDADSAVLPVFPIGQGG